MAVRQIFRLSLAATCARGVSVRTISSTTRFLEAKPHPNVDGHRETQSKKPLGPHMTNTTSTIANEMPSVGADKAPPELLTSVDPDFAPKDAHPENTERMTGGTQKQSQEKSDELHVGQMSESEFKIDPLRREGEDANTIRARKRGTLESDLLLSTFADANLAKMNMNQLRQYDLFLDENDWDIYYWATQEPSPTNLETAEGSSPNYATPAAQGKKAPSDSLSGGSLSSAWSKDGQSQSGEWAQTVGTFKPAYRPVPARWKNSEILSLLRRHVIERSAGGVHSGEDVVAPAGDEGKGGGLGRMPEVKNFDT